MSSCILSVLLPVLIAGGPGGPTSGPQVGEALPDVKIRAVTGPRGGQDFDLPADIKQKPSLIVITQRGSRKVRSFLTTVEWYAAKQGSGSLAAHFVFLEQEGLTRAELPLLAKGDRRRPPMLSPLSWLESKKAAAFKLHDKTALTVLLVKDGKVTSNFALIEPNNADAARVVAAAAKLLGKDPPTLQVQKEKENVVASKLEGTWQSNVQLWKRFAGNEKPENTVYIFKSDLAIAAKIPLMYLSFFEGKPIYMAGTMRRNADEHLFVLTSLNGNPHLVYFRPRGGDPLGDAESFNLFVSVARETQNDLLFIGGDFNNQPFYPFERVK